MELPPGNFGVSNIYLGKLAQHCFGYIDARSLYTDGTMLFLPRTAMVSAECDDDPGWMMRIENNSTIFHAYRIIFLGIYRICWQLNYIDHPDGSFIRISHVRTVYNDREYAGLDVGITGPQLSDLQIHQTAFIDVSALRVAALGPKQRYYAPAGGNSLVSNRATPTSWIVKRTPEGFKLRRGKDWIALHLSDQPS